MGVFTRSLNAPFSDADTVHPNDLLSYVSAMRRREDAEFLKLMPGLQMVDLNLKDATLRLRCSADELYAVHPSPEDTAVAKIRKALARISAERPIDVILLPFALGHHVDHLVARNAALAFAAIHAFAFYEDLPDALHSHVDVGVLVGQELNEMHEQDLFVDTVGPVVLDGGEEAEKTKRRIVSVYASQIDDASMTAISEFASHYTGGERIWASPAFIALPLNADALTSTS